MNVIRRIREEILKGRKFLITTHINSEGDAIGSELAFYYLLRRLKKRVRIINADAVPENLKFLPGVKKIEKFKPGMMDLNGDEIMIVLDAPTPERIGSMSIFLDRLSFVINIDHHLSNKKFGNLNWVDKNASSVGEMVFSLYKSFNLPLDFKISLLIYTAIVTDTGSFRYINTSSQTHKIVSILIEKGVKPYKVYTKVFENISIEKLRLLGLSLSRIEQRNGIAWIEITSDLLLQSGASEEDLEGVVDYIRGLKDIKVAVVFQEQGEGIIKVIFRSKDEKIDVNKIADYFGGGGHKMASGCRVKGDLKVVRRKVLKKVRDFL